MKSLILFSEVVLRNLGTWCDVSTQRDIKTVTQRVEHEGLSFLTITLSDFAKNLDRSLAEGCWIPLQSFSNWRGLPRFLGGFLDQVFDRGTGRLLETPSHTAIWALRQFCMMWAKIELEATPRRRRAAVARWVKCEQEVEQHVGRLLADHALLDQFIRMSRLLYADLFSSANGDIHRGELRPRHGPGATADGLVGNDKWRQLEWPQRLEEVFRASEHLYPNELAAFRSGDQVRYLEPWREKPVKVTLVPKTQKTPRVIAIEPTAMQYMQQAIGQAFARGIREHDILKDLIGLKDQLPNRDMAHEGSLNGDLATLDLSEASDRVSTLHVELLFVDHGLLRDAVFAVRSSKARVPGDDTVRYLSKYASMGSALTFPLEAMVFLTVVCLGIEKALNRQLRRRDLRDLVGRVRVYGDDIIVPTDYASSVIETLEAFGLKVNSDKSFWTGKFRESCGGDYYAGTNVTPIRLRAVFPSSPRHAPELISTVSTRNQLYYAGLWDAARYLDSMLEGFMPLPHVEPTSPVLGRNSFLGLEEPERWHTDYHSPLVKGRVVYAPNPASPLDGYAALNKWFLLFPRQPSEDEDHLERAGRPKVVRTRVRWASPF